MKATADWELRAQPQPSMQMSTFKSMQEIKILSLMQQEFLKNLQRQRIIKFKQKICRQMLTNLGRI
jgi:hypothetical protein